MTEIRINPQKLSALDNVVQPFRVETLELRARMVKTGRVLNKILHNHKYPKPVAYALGEALLLTSCLAKFS